MQGADTAAAPRAQCCLVSDLLQTSETRKERSKQQCELHSLTALHERQGHGALLLLHCAGPPYTKIESVVTIQGAVAQLARPNYAY